MKLDELVTQALSKIDSMSVDEFEGECHKAGYVPIRKPQFSMHAGMVVNAESAVGIITYRHNVVLNGKGDQSYGSDSSEESSFPIAA